MVQVIQTSPGVYKQCCCEPVASCCINIENVVVTPNPVPVGAAFTVDVDFVNCGSEDLASGYAVLTGLPVGVSMPLGNTVTWPGIPTVGFVHKQYGLLNEATTSQALNMLITANDSCAIGGAVTDSQTVPVSVIGGPPVPHINLYVSKDLVSPNSQPVGSPVSFVIDIYNSGPNVADGTTVVDNAPACFTFQGQTTAVFGGAVITGTYPNWTITTLPVGGMARITLNGVSNAVGSCVNSVTATPPVGTIEDDPINNTATATFTATAPPSRTVDIFTVKTGSDPAIGTNQVFHNIYTNNGPDNANGLKVIDVPGTGYGSRWSLSTIAGVSISYTGGASGPATATIAQLLAGITIPTWPNGGQVDVAYSIHGDVAGTPNQNCANVVTVPGLTISNPAGAEFCLPFIVPGVGNCSCSATYDVTPVDRVVGQNFTATYTLPPSGDLSCCNVVEFRTLTYPTLQDAIDDTNGVDTAAIAATTCASLGTSGNFPFVAGTAGWYRYYIRVINNGSPQPQFCSISDSNQVFGNAPLPNKHTVAISGTWTYHTIT